MRERQSRRVERANMNNGFRARPFLVERKFLSRISDPVRSGLRVMTRRIFLICRVLRRAAHYPRDRCQRQRSQVRAARLPGAQRGRGHTARHVHTQGEGHGRRLRGERRDRVPRERRPFRGGRVGHRQQQQAAGRGQQQCVLRVRVDRQGQR